MVSKVYPSQEVLREYFTYDDDQGVLIRRKNSANRKAGEVAGYVGDNGYRLIRVQGAMYGSHRLIWIFFNGPIPEGYEIDHANGNQFDDRISNLRLASRMENMRNRAMYKNNSSGYKGVCFEPKRKGANPWRARIVVNKKRIALGMYPSPELAHEAYKKAALKFFGEFARF